MALQSRDPQGRCPVMTKQIWQLHGGTPGNARDGHQSLEAAKRQGGTLSHISEGA